jgi:hypothetical protein
VIADAPPALRLNLGCGQVKMDGYTGVDRSSDCGADVVHDLTSMPWPFESDSVEEARASHFLEHLTGVQRMAFMDELWRVLKPQGAATIITPYWASARAIQDPTHQWPPIAESSYLYFNKQWREGNGLAHYPIRCDFDFTYGYQIEQPWAVRSAEARDFAVRHYQHVVTDLQVVLTKRT